jgi:hypothetical protein
LGGWPGGLVWRAIDGGSRHSTTVGFVSWDLVFVFSVGWSELTGHTLSEMIWILKLVMVVVGEGEIGVRGCTFCTFYVDAVNCGSKSICQHFVIHSFCLVRFQRCHFGFYVKHKCIGRGEALMDYTFIITLGLMVVYIRRGYYPECILSYLA